MGAPDVAVIVTSYQIPWHLRRVLESIACQRTSHRLEVVVGDDGSTDETPQVVSEFASRMPFPVRFITHPHTAFHAALCRNNGVRHSSAPHLFFFDGDCLLPPDHIERHLAAWRPGTATSSYCVRFDQALSEQVTLDVVRSGEFTAWIPPQQRSKLHTMHIKAALYELIRHPTKPAFRSGAFSLSRADFQRVNGFDEVFYGWGCEDDDFGRRLRAAGVRTASVLNRTCVYHLWHPPAPTRPQEWKRGSNVAYLQRPIRLTRCLHGLEVRTPPDLTVRLAGRAADMAAQRRLVALYGWVVKSTAKVRTDLELLCRPGRGRFSGRCDCRVLAVFDEPSAEQLEMLQPHVVLSARGNIGHSEQVPLALDDTAGLWAAIQGIDLQPHRAAA